jgi:hypothetical protein
MSACPPHVVRRLAEADQHRSQFIDDFRVREVPLTGRRLGRILKLACGGQPERLDEIRGLLAQHGLHGVPRWPAGGGALDHPSLWARDGVPCILVSYPYFLTDENRRLLDELAKFPAIRVGVDDRPGFHEALSHHVRVEVVLGAAL